MWWHRRSSTPKEVTITAHLKKGQMLHIRFNDAREEPRQLDIEGHGEVRLKVRSLEDVEAEVVRKP